MDLKLVLCVLFLSLGVVCGQYSRLSCSSGGSFSYENDGDNLYGRIVLQPNTPVSTLEIRINFTIAAEVIGNYAGRIDAEDGNALLPKYNRGEAVAYRVYFPLTSPVPKITSLTANGDIICSGPGDIALPNSYLSTLSLQHTSFVQSGNRVVYTRPRPQSLPRPLPQSRPDQLQNLIYNYGDDGTAQIYTFEPTWNNGPYYVVNTSRPFTRPTRPVYPPPTQEIFVPSRDPPPNRRPQGRPDPEETLYYPDPVTVRPRPVATRRPPVYQPVVDTPVYEPETRPQSRPDPEQDLYDPDRISARPSPVASNRPVLRPQIRPNPESDVFDSNRGTTYRPVVTQRPSSQIENPVTMDDCGTIDPSIALIYHGQSYPRGDLPWLVALFRTEGGSLKFICGGTLVSNRHVITAAHCLRNRSKPTSYQDIVVKIGVHDLDDWKSGITVIRTLIAAAIHEDFTDTPALRNDITVFTLDERVEFTQFIRPVCLWKGDPDQSRIVDMSGVVAGWGDQSAGGVGRLKEPHKVSINIVSTAKCRSSKLSFHKLTSETSLCAGNRDGSGPCVGDSGGGLYMKEGGKWRLRGIVSLSLRAANGDATCNLDEYVVFTDAAQYLPWIRKIMSQNFYD